MMVVKENAILRLVWNEKQGSIFTMKDQCQEQTQQIILDQIKPIRVKRKKSWQFNQDFVHEVQQLLQSRPKIEQLVKNQRSFNEKFEQSLQKQSSKWVFIIDLDLKPQTALLIKIQSALRSKMILTTSNPLPKGIQEFSQNTNTVAVISHLERSIMINGGWRSLTSQWGYDGLTAVMATLSRICHDWGAVDCLYVGYSEQSALLRNSWNTATSRLIRKAFDGYKGRYFDVIDSYF